MIVEADAQYVLFREIESRSPYFVLVNFASYNSLIKINTSGGMFALSALLNCNKKNLRFLTYKHKESVIEEGTTLRDIILDWILDTGVKIDSLLNLLSWVQYHNKIRIDVGFSGIIRNPVIFQQYNKSKEHLTNFRRIFQFIPNDGKFNELEHLIWI